VLDGKHILIVDCWIDNLTIINTKNAVVVEGSKITNCCIKNGPANSFK
jgi:hypothetical protein